VLWPSPLQTYTAHGQEGSITLANTPVHSALLSHTGCLNENDCDSLYDATRRIKARDGELSLLSRLLNLPGQANIKQALLSWFGNIDNAGTLFAPSDAALNAFLLSVGGPAPTLADLDRPEVRAVTSNLLRLHLVPENIYKEGNDTIGVQFPGPGEDHALTTFLGP